MLLFPAAISNKHFVSLAWTGGAPNCASDPTMNADCPDDKPIKLAAGRQGDGGVACTTGFMSYSCAYPPPFQNCVWNTAPAGQEQPDPNDGPLPLCQGSCGPGQILLTTDTSNCDYGSQALCCDAPVSMFPCETLELRPERAD